MKMAYVIIFSKDNNASPVSITLQETRATNEVAKLNKILIDNDPKETGWFYYLPIQFLDKDCIMDFKQ
jgi:hypothetical protein